MESTVRNFDFKCVNFRNKNYHFSLQMNVVHVAVASDGKQEEKNLLRPLTLALTLRLTLLALVLGLG